MGKKRPDGVYIDNINPYTKIMPHIMPHRYDAMNWCKVEVSCDGIDRFIAEQHKLGKRYSYYNVVMAALVGACVGFLPYNLNPAKMFMGDTGATFLGFILSTMSIQGLFKFYAVISFAVPFLILGLPIFDTAFAMIRRMAHGQSPMHADRGHIHHRLIDMGFSQKQAVAIAYMLATLYVISGILGLSAVVLTTGGEAKAMLLLIALCVVAVVAARVVFPKEVKEELHEELEELTELGHHEEKDKQKEDGSHE